MGFFLAETPSGTCRILVLLWKSRPVVELHHKEANHAEPGAERAKGPVCQGQRKTPQNGQLGIPQLKCSSAGLALLLALGLQYACLGQFQCPHRDTRIVQALIVMFIRRGSIPSNVGCAHVGHSSPKQALGCPGAFLCGPARRGLMLDKKALAGAPPVPETCIKRCITDYGRR